MKSSRNDDADQGETDSGREKNKRSNGVKLFLSYFKVVYEDAVRTKICFQDCNLCSRTAIRFLSSLIFEVFDQDFPNMLFQINSHLFPGPVFSLAKAIFLRIILQD